MEEQILILSKTNYGKNNVCVGGMILSNNKYVRLLNPGGWYQYADTSFEVGDIWEITFEISSSLKEPHNEDIIIGATSYIRKITDITSFIKSRNLPIWKGSIDTIFEAKLRWASSGSGFLSINFPNYPKNSVGFWMSDKKLILENDYYIYPTDNSYNRRKLPYKGVVSPVKEIPQNTLIRVSLAKWWKPQDSDVEERCYAQLSGWYDYNEPKNNSQYDDDDLPF